MTVFNLLLLFLISLVSGELGQSLQSHSRVALCPLNDCPTNPKCCDANGACIMRDFDVPTRCFYCTADNLVCAGKAPGPICDASQCQNGCCTKDGKCGTIDQCNILIAREAICAGDGCSTCCKANKRCASQHEMALGLCVYCSNSPDYLICPGKTKANGPCVPEECQFGCCFNGACGTKEQCDPPAKCNVDRCFGETNIKCCNKFKFCVSDQSQCYFCGEDTLCDGVDFSPAQCSATMCQSKCCDGNKCGTPEICRLLEEKSKAWIYYALGGTVILVILIGVFILLRRPRTRLVVRTKPANSQVVGYNELRQL